MSVPFIVSVVALVASPVTREGVARSLLDLRSNGTTLEPAREPSLLNEGVRFVPRTVDSAEGLLKLLRAWLRSARPYRVVVISDRLVQNEAGRDRANALTLEIRSLFNAQTTHILGMVALIDGEAGRLTDIDMVVNQRTVAPVTLQRAIWRVACALWLKSAPGAQRTLCDAGAVKVRFVRSIEEMNACLRLRFLVYEALGYLEERIARLSARIELDTYDKHALHLCGVERRSGHLAGTLRLVLPADRRRASTSGSDVPAELVLEGVRALQEVAPAQRFWVRSIADTEPVLIDKLREENPLTPFPIMDSTDFAGLWPQFLRDYDYRETAEISRVIVAPKSRGLGVSALLMRAAIAAATELQVRHLLLECVPTHVRMYQKYGFEPLPQRHCRARELDQFAVGMRLEVNAKAMPRETMAHLQGDLRMLRLGLKPKTALLGSRGLCLCRSSACWRRAGYGGWGTPTCPMVKDMPLT